LRTHRRDLQDEFADKFSDLRVELAPHPLLGTTSKTVGGKAGGGSKAGAPPASKNGSPSKGTTPTAGKGFGAGAKGGRR
jgi:hypothetical protein